MSEQKDLEDLSIVIRSEIKYEILSLLDESRLTPKHMAVALGKAISQISYALHVLKQRQLVRCLNEQAKRGRIYEITTRGQMIYQDAKRIRDRLV